MLVLESTYGDRLHGDDAADDARAGRRRRAHRQRGAGALVVPAFAVGRTQELVATLHELIEAGRLRELPIFVDSPMASKATQVFRTHPECFDDETRRQFRRGRRRAVRLRAPALRLLAADESWR